MGGMAIDAGPSTIQASSLADIIDIADCPPQKPSPRRHGGRPLELYIVRVPGSRDIFLTTLKPRDKVVTAQDVESCLYYCHLETENDGLFRDEDDYFGEDANDDAYDQEGRQSLRSSQEEQASPISRARAAALPPLSEPGFDSSMDSLHLAPALPPRPGDLGLDPSSTGIKRKPVHSSNDSQFIGVTTSAPMLPPRPAPTSMPMPTSVPEAKPSPTSSPRLLGPRPLADRGQSGNNIFAVPPIVTEFAGSQTYLPKPPELPRRPVSISSSSLYLRDQRVPGTLPYPVSPTNGAGKENVDNRRWTMQPPPVPAHGSAPGNVALQSANDLPWMSNDHRSILSSTTNLDSSLQKPSLPPRPGSLSPSSTYSPHRSNSAASRIPAGISPLSSQTAQPPTSSFNITLIRRNPSTGDQVNVAKISVPSSSHRGPSKVLIQIFTPGYAQFRSISAPSTASLVRCISEDDDCTFSTDLRLATRRRSIKSPTSPYFGDVPVNQLMSVTPSQPYSFLGPWNRVCEFSTGVGGRSLKCRHMLGRGVAGGSLDSESEASASASASASAEARSVMGLSELRFNTPSTKLWTKGGRQKPEEKRRPVSRLPHPIHRKGAAVFGAHAHAPNQHSLHHSSHSNLATSRFSNDSGSTTASVFSSAPQADGRVFDDDDGGGYQDRDRDWDVEPMDLTLGQERAGGGFKGNKAKLGKLVVEPEGLEMLDLLVAANMGIWWSIR